MAESDNDDKVGEDDSDGDLETSRKLFFKKAKGNKKTSVSLLISYEAISKNVSARVSKQP